MPMTGGTVVAVGPLIEITAAGAQSDAAIKEELSFPALLGLTLLRACEQGGLPMPSDGAPSFYAATIGVWSRLREAGPAARPAPISAPNISALECAPWGRTG